MAITDPGSVKLSYLDMVQLEQSGAGLPAHAGKEAALYDGSGAQILGRTAVRHWLDPHPDAASFDETWEFSTTGDMTQGELETLGWTFSNCTAEVTNGILVLTATAASVLKASLDISFAGDFDILTTPISAFSYNTSSSPYDSTTRHGGIGVADYRAGTADNAQYVLTNFSNGIQVVYRYAAGAFTTLGGSVSTGNCYAGDVAVRVWRVSGTVYFGGVSCGSVPQGAFVSDDTAQVYAGFSNNASTSDSSTFNKLILVGGEGNVNVGARYGFANIRRFQ